MENLNTMSKTIEGCIEKLHNEQNNRVMEISSKIEQIKGLVLMMEEFSDNFIVSRNERKSHEIGFVSSFSAVYSLLELLEKECTENANVYFDVEKCLREIV